MAHEDETSDPQEESIPRRRKRSFRLEQQAVGDFVIDRLNADLMERQEWMNKRIIRYAKIRGWLPKKGWPWPNSSNVWVPVIASATLRLISALFNAVLGKRPVIQAAAMKKVDHGKEERIDQLLDWQMFVEQDGFNKLDDYITNFVNDGTSFAMVNWAKERQTITDVRVQPALRKDLEAVAQFADRIDALYPKVVSSLPKGKEEWEWDVVIEENGESVDITVEFYERDDDQLEIHSHRKVTTSDGPAFVVQDLEDIVAPRRVANLQPITPENPNGAPYFSRIGKTSLDSILRRWEEGIYDLISEDDWTKISESRPADYTAKEDERMKEEKDRKEGFITGQVGSTGQYKDIKGAPEDLNPHQIIEHYGRWDVNGDGLEEDVIFWVHRDTKILLRARYLTEIYPGVPVRRPVAEARFIRVPNQLYGIGLPELIEPLYDMTKTLMDMNIDWGEIRNTPFFFYRSSSSLTPETIRLAPGDGYPLDDPQGDIHFPNMGNQNNSWIFNTLNLIQVYEERLTMQSDVQFGRVPSGRSAALRTVGTTKALLAQGDVRSEQVLRRLFNGIVQVYVMFHRLNKSNLTGDKEIRIVGIPEEGQDLYQTVTKNDLDSDMDFQFKATMMNTDRQAMREGMLQMAGLILSPLAIQMGIVDRGSVFRFYQDVFKVQELDAERYIVPPSKEDTRKRLSFKDAMDLIVRGIPPQGVPLEQPQVHLEKLIQFRESEAFGAIPEEFMGLFAVWASEVQRMAQEQQALQQQAQAAAQGQQQSQEPQEDGREAAPVEEGAVQADPAGPNDAQGL